MNRHGFDRDQGKLLKRSELNKQTRLDFSSFKKEPVARQSQENY